MERKSVIILLSYLLVVIACSEKKEGIEQESCSVNAATRSKRPNYLYPYIIRML